MSTCHGAPRDMHEQVKLHGLIPPGVMLFYLMMGFALLAPNFAAAQDVAFIAPPRTIADITAILDQQKPNPRIVAKDRADADATPPANASRAEVAEFHYARGAVRSKLGRFGDAIADAQSALDYGNGQLAPERLLRMRSFYANQSASAGDPKTSLEIFFAIAREAEQRTLVGWMLNANRRIIEQLITLGDFNRADAYLKKSDALMQTFRQRRGYAEHESQWEHNFETGRARLYEARGRFREAEESYRKAEHWYSDLVATSQAGKIKNAPARGFTLQNQDELIASQGRMKARQGRGAEGEADVRRALLRRLKATGKYNLRTAEIIGTLAGLLVEQGRFAEAEQLTRRQLEILQAMGVPADVQSTAAVLDQLASVLNLQSRWEDAGKVYAELDAATKNWEPARREALILNASHIATLYNTGTLAAGVAAAERLAARQKARYGDKHVETALARGLLAFGLARSGRDADALREFRLAVPVLTAASHEIDSDDAVDVAAREQRVQLVIESYMVVLARTGASDAANESFRLADVVRGRSVQKALAASSARSAARDPALTTLARKAQDLEKQVAAQLGFLNNLLTLPPRERDDGAIKALQAEIDNLRTARDAAKRELAGKFPAYSNLVEPQLATVADIRGVLRPDEAFLSFYFGREVSFVWAVPKSGPIAFATIAATGGEVDRKVQALRRALEPDVAAVGDIPPFDIALAHELYALLLEPARAAWQPAKRLIVATNGALGLLPLGLLPTERTEPDANARPVFAGYRSVPWLARTHAVTLVPSVSAFKTLRQLPAGSDKRERLIGFGDPVFSAAQAAALLPEAASELASGMPLRRRAASQTRGVDTAQLALLPRLPDTAEELKSIALALQADPSKVLHLGKAANEEAVKKTDLSKYRIIVFATHGLVPGDLDGLTQPALALSAPDVAGVSGDGLLTMEEILALKLDADWVVLSACNTGAGAAAGAEAASGLGRAFFYAGTRAILVTNWSVHSQSARELVSDLFRRQATDPKLPRAEALRQAMMALLDGKGFTDPKGETVFTYAHPLFWAPYTIIGDGG
jgi:CHAT domain-containing protein/tetratricopeptide (TPR) repeat protein